MSRSIRRPKRGSLASWWSCLGLLLGLVSVAPAWAESPQSVVAQFCRFDAEGARLSAWDMRRVAWRIGWPLEPAWDRVLLITGYSVGDAQAIAPGLVEVAVDYSVVGRIEVDGFEAEQRSDRVILRLRWFADAWRLVGAPPEPRLFASRVDVEGIRRLLRGERGIVANSMLVYALLHAAGWQVPLESTREMMAGGTYVPVDTPEVGDLALYVRDGMPYHVGVVEAPGVIVSATLAAGVVRATPRTFAGELRYLRLRQGIERRADVPTPHGE